MVNAIRTACHNINHFTNGISMQSLCQNYFDGLDFYLNPYLDTMTPETLIVSFHWTNEACPLTNGWVTRPEYFRTGDVIVLRTNDPENLPLPDPAFLLVRMMITKIRFPRGGGSVTDNGNWFHEPDQCGYQECSSSAS